MPQVKGETLHRAYFLPCGHVAGYGGAVTIATAWLDREAAQAGRNGAQLSLLLTAILYPNDFPNPVLARTQAGFGDRVILHKPYET